MFFFSIFSFSSTFISNAMVYLILNCYGSHTNISITTTIFSRMRAYISSRSLKQLNYIIHTCIQPNRYLVLCIVLHITILKFVFSKNFKWIKWNWNIKCIFTQWFQYIFQLCLSSRKLLQWRKIFLQTYKKANQLTSRWQFKIQFVNMQRTFAFASTICAIWLLEKTFSFFYHLKQKPEKKKHFKIYLTNDKKTYF